MMHILSDKSWWHQLVSNNVPIDTTLVVCFVLAADPIVLFVTYPPVRAVFGLPLLLFLPGYAVVTVLFPARSSHFLRRLTTRSDTAYRSITTVERMALSIGLSFALLPLIALGFWAIDPQGFDTLVLLGVLTTVIVFGMVYGTHRRLQLSKGQRYRVPVNYWTEELMGNVLSGKLSGTMVNLALVISIVLAAGTLGYVIVVPNQSASYTRVSLLNSDASGDLSVANYSTDIVAGTEIDLILAIENRERTSTSYTIIVKIKRIRNDGQNVSSNELIRLRTVVPPGETDYVNHTISPTMVGDNLKLQYLIYKGEPPTQPTAANAYRTLFLWIDISNGQSTDNISEIKTKDEGEQTAIVRQQVIS